MQDRLPAFLQPPAFPDNAVMNRRARLLNFASLATFAGAFAFLVANIFIVTLAAFFTDLGTWIAAGVAAAALLTQVFMRLGLVRLAAVFIVALFWLLLVVGTVALGGFNPATFPQLVMPVVLAALLLGPRSALSVVVASILVGVALLYGYNNGLMPPPFTDLDDASTLGVVGAMLLLVAGLVNRATLNLSSALEQVTSANEALEATRKELEGRVAERTVDLANRAQQLRAAADVGRAAASFTSLDDLLPRVAELISERFGFYQVGIFLLDANREWAVMRAANSPGGKAMLARSHRLKVGEQGIVGYVTAYGEARIALDVGEDAVFFDNPELPDTRSEMALPLVVRGEVIGALDVQSTQPAAFRQEDVDVLRVLADQVAVAISNARLFEQAQETLEAERRAFGEITRRNWQQLAETRRQLAFRSDPYGVQRLSDYWRPEMALAVAQRQTVVDRSLTLAQDAEVLAVPITVRGVVIGVLNTRKPLEFGRWQADEIAVVENVVEQLGVALEGARLYEETQQLAEREQTRADIAGKVLASADMDVILRTAIEELSRAFDASEATIDLSIAPPANPNGTSDADDLDTADTPEPDQP